MKKKYNYLSFLFISLLSLIQTGMASNVQNVKIEPDSNSIILNFDSDILLKKDSMNESHQNQQIKLKISDSSIDMKEPFFESDVGPFREVMVYSDRDGGIRVDAKTSLVVGTVKVESNNKQIILRSEFVTSSVDRKKSGISTSYSLKWQMLKMALALILTLGLFFLCIYGFKKLSNGFNFKKGVGSDRLIQFVASHSVGRHQSLQIVKVLDQYILLGISPTALQHLGNLGSSSLVEKKLEGREFNQTIENHLSELSESP